MVSTLHRFVVRSLVKRSPSTEPQLEAVEDYQEDEELSEEEEAARRGQVSFSITANFQALQQKLMRELWSRSPTRVWSRVPCCSIPLCIYFSRMWWPDPEYWGQRDEPGQSVYNNFLTHIEAGLHNKIYVKLVMISEKFIIKIRPDQNSILCITKWFSNIEPNPLALHLDTSVF